MSDESLSDRLRNRFLELYQGAHEARALVSAVAWPIDTALSGLATELAQKRDRALLDALERYAHRIDAQKRSTGTSSGANSSWISLSTRSRHRDGHGTTRSVG